ncbi:hypothetical protein SNEBB_001620 [Seison nebaliae]|nr:hypothetical protein SNEBB_001620 [Seison nebaliae]
MNSILIKLFLLFTLTISTSFAIKCYHCEKTKECRDPLRYDLQTVNSTILKSVECESQCWIGYFSDTYQRGCGEKRCTIQPDLKFMGNVCCKDQDYCNGAISSQFSGSFTTIVMFVSVLIALSLK